MHAKVAPCHAVNENGNKKVHLKAEANIQGVEVGE